LYELAIRLAIDELELVVGYTIKLALTRSREINPEKEIRFYRVRAYGRRKIDYFFSVGSFKEGPTFDYRKLILGFLLEIGFLIFYIQLSRSKNIILRIDYWDTLLRDALNSASYAEKGSQLICKTNMC
jgi:hypothetical protein